MLMTMSSCYANTPKQRHKLSKRQWQRGCKITWGSRSIQKRHTLLDFCTRFRFLGYDLRGHRNPNGSRWLRLSIPPEKERDLKAKVKRLCTSGQLPELHLFVRVNAQLVGWTN